MSLKFRAWRRGFAAAVFFVLLLAGCGDRLEYTSEEGPVFPPTPTFPVVAAPILLVDNNTQAVSMTATPGAPPVSQGKVIVTEATAVEELVRPTLPAMTPTSTTVPEPTALPTATPCPLPGEVTTGQFESTLAGPINYRVYLPPCYLDSGPGYPALYMLPGNIYTDAIWDDLGLDEAAEAGIKEKRYEPMLIVMVSGGTLANYTSGGAGSYEIFMMEEFIPYIEASYCALSEGRGRAIGGMSRGGYWALEIAFRNAQEFASVGGHSAALLDFNGGPTINPLETGLNNDLNGLRVYLDIGENDWVIANVRQLHEDMENAGRDHVWILNEGSHEEAYWAAHVQDYLDWYAEPWLGLNQPSTSCREALLDTELGLSN